MFYEFLPKLNGSCVRSVGLLSGLASHGVGLAAVSSPFQPGFGGGTVETYQGVRVYRAYRPGAPEIADHGSSVWARLRKIASLLGFARFIHRVSKGEAATIIHAHSTFYCAIASWLAARALGVPLIYECRSVWEERAKGLGFLYRIQAHLTSWLEDLSFRLADRVVAINEALKEEIASRGVPAAKIVVVANAVDDVLIEMGGHLKPPVRVTRFGYIGSQTTNEGLELLVRAFQAAFSNDEAVELLFYGAGPYERELKHLVQASMDPRIAVRGKFSREQVQAVYGSVDCVVLPRCRSKLNDTVTPLKPLEAMAFNRLVVVSDVGGLIEVIGERANAFVFAADDAHALASTLRLIYAGDVDVVSTVRRGHEFVCKHRAWSAVARAYSEIYNDVSRDRTQHSHIEAA